MRRLFYYLCGVLVMSCVPQKTQAELKRWDRAGLNQYTQHVAREKGWRLVAEGWCRDGDIEEIKVTYNVRKPMLLAEARRVIVEEVQKAVPMIQTKQRPVTLANIGLPFTYKSLCYMLSFNDKTGGSYSAPYLDTVALVCGDVIYRIEYQKVHEETFEEALRIVEAESRGDFSEQDGARRTLDECTNEL
ncbi:MAG: hypothetical protein Q8K75_06235 [Chlamydiales bacterium]|nr:hypothetical protein [Chlamydiales bacterium]